jgi:hypothetical protein
MGYDTASNSNNVIQFGMFNSDPETGGHARAHEMQWVFLMDDDHVFPYDILLKLLDRDVDVVLPLYVQRRPPHWPCVFHEKNGPAGFPIYSWDELAGKQGLLEVASAGKGGLLIRRPVLEKLGELWRKEEAERLLPGQAPAGHPAWFAWEGRIGEDHTFYTKVRELGYKVYVDLDIVMKHITPHTMGAYRDPADGRWCPEVDLHNGQTIQLWTAGTKGRA